MTEPKEALQLAPVTAWEIKEVPAVNALIVRLDFLSNAMQSPDEAHPGRNYVLHTAEARRLAEQILAGCEALERGGTAPDARQRH